MNEHEFENHLRALEVDVTLPAATLLRPSIEARVRDSEATAVKGDQRAYQTDPELKLGDTLGSGGMGLVRSATQVALRREVAVKSLLAEHSGGEHRRSLLREALTMGALEHPNIVPVYCLAEGPDGAPMIVMKRVEGVPWSHCLADVQSAPGLVPDDPLEWHLDILSQVCRAVHFAHSKGIVHRDIKPDNVMLGAFGEVYLVDWGIAVTVDDAWAEVLLHVSQVSSPGGTPQYMAPEMTTGLGNEIGPHTDIYLLGSTLAEILSGEPPHKGGSLLEVMFAAYESKPVHSQTGPEELLEICHRAMARQPADRFESADALRRALQEFRSHRYSVALGDETRARFEDLLELMQESSADDLVLYSIASEVRFGLNQALKVWPENKTARAERVRFLESMVRWELGKGNVDGATGWITELSEVAPELADEIEQAKRARIGRDAEIAALEDLRRESDLGVGAAYRAALTFVAVIVWTILPLLGGVLTGWGERPLSHERYLAQSLIVMTFVLVLSRLFTRKIQQNRANSQILQLVTGFVVIIPLYRLLAMLGSIPTPVALAVEMGLYGGALGALSLASERSALPPLIFYGAAALASVTHLDFVYLFLALGNFCGIGWIAWIWARHDGTVQPD